MRFASFLVTTPSTGQPCACSSDSTLWKVPLPKTPSTEVAAPRRLRARCRERTPLPVGPLAGGLVPERKTWWCFSLGFAEAGATGAATATSASATAAHVNDLGFPMPIGSSQLVYGARVAHPCKLGVNAHH